MASLNASQPYKQHYLLFTMHHTWPGWLMPPSPPSLLSPKVIDRRWRRPESRRGRAGSAVLLRGGRCQSKGSPHGSIMPCKPAACISCTFLRLQLASFRPHCLPRKEPNRCENSKVSLQARKAERQDSRPRLRPRRRLVQQVARPARMRGRQVCHGGRQRGRDANRRRWPRLPLYEARQRDVRQEEWHACRSPACS